MLIALSSSAIDVGLGVVLSISTTTAKASPLTMLTLSSGWKKLSMLAKGVLQNHSMTPFSTEES